MAMVNMVNLKWTMSPRVYSPHLMVAILLSTSSRLLTSIVLRYHKVSGMRGLRNCILIFRNVSAFRLVSSNLNFVNACRAMIRKPLFFSVGFYLILSYGLERVGKGGHTLNVYEKQL